MRLIEGPDTTAALPPVSVVGRPVPHMTADVFARTMLSLPLSFRSASSRRFIGGSCFALLYLSLQYLSAGAVFETGLQALASRFELVRCGLYERLAWRPGAHFTGSIRPRLSWTR